MLDHVTYHVTPGTLDSADLKLFMASLGFHERDPRRDGLEDGWEVRWFQKGWPRPSTLIHFVQTDDGREDILKLGHFCVKVGRSRFDGLKRSKYCVRNSGSGRIWMEFANLRVEVRP